jgi:hypothetical protein
MFSCFHLQNSCFHTQHVSNVTIYLAGTVPYKNVTRTSVTQSMKFPSLESRYGIREMSRRYGSNIMTIHVILSSLMKCCDVEAWGSHGFYIIGTTYMNDFPLSVRVCEAKTFVQRCSLGLGSWVLLCAYIRLYVCSLTPVLWN